MKHSLAKKLLIGGGVGLFTGVALSLVILLPLYSKVGDCLSGGNSCTDDFSAAQIQVRLVYILLYTSLVALIAGVVVLLASSVKAKKQAMKTQATAASNTRAIKHLLMKTLAFVVAFFVGGSIASVVVAELIPILYPSKSTGEQGYIFAYVIIGLYPTTGALAIYLTSKWLKKKRR